MYPFVLYSLQIFFIVLDCIVLLYLMRFLFAVLPFGDKIVSFIVTLMVPMWVPMQYLLKRSILHTFQFDLSPYLLLLVLTYLQDICSILLK